MPASTLATTVVARRDTFLRLVRGERTFLVLLAIGFLLAGATYSVPLLAMWVGFVLAAYSTVANDSIQTIGTFIASNHGRRWWVLWLFIGGVFLATVSYGWWAYDGDVSFGRLSAKGFAEAPASFTFLQVAAPLFLLILTRLRMPVSTTFLLLSCFTTSAVGIQAVLLKSLSGYVVAFVVGLGVWVLLSRVLAGGFTGTPGRVWGPLQWASTAFLWSGWIMQDAANVAVYLPRRLSVDAFLAFALTIFFGLGILFYLRGDRIQRVVTEKTDTTDIRAATVIDFVYALLLFAFKEVSVIPMSTTWVFIGLLGGRELGLSIGRAVGHRPLRTSWRLMRKDLAYAGVGLTVSIVLALAANTSLLR